MPMLSSIHATISIDIRIKQKFKSELDTHFARMKFDLGHNLDHFYREALELHGIVPYTFNTKISVVEFGLTTDTEEWCMYFHFGNFVFVFTGDLSQGIRSREHD